MGIRDMHEPKRRSDCCHDLGRRIEYDKQAVKDIVLKVWPYIVAGILIGAAIHGFVPQGLMAKIMGAHAWWSVPLAVLIAIPMYSNAAGIIPIVEALLAKGAALGTVLAFMMSVIGLSLPQMVILRKVLKPALIGVFIGVVGVGIIIVGFVFNALAGSPKCKKLTETADQAAKSLGIEYTLEKVTDINEIVNFGVMMTPALVVDGAVKVGAFN